MDVITVCSGSFPRLAFNDAAGEPMKLNQVNLLWSISFNQLKLLFKKQILGPSIILFESSSPKHHQEHVSQGFNLN